MGQKKRSMKNTKLLSSTNLAFMALFSALIVICTMIAIPMPSGVPITLQTFAIALCGFVLGAKRGTISVAVYIALGVVGLPVFSGFSGGIGKLAGVTGGFIWGFILMVVLCGLGTQTKRATKVLPMVFGVLGLLACHLAGILQFSIITGTPFIASALTVSLPYMIKDIVSVAAALIMAKILSTALKKANIKTELS